MYLWLTDYSYNIINNFMSIVVICFLIVSLTYWLQHKTVLIYCLIVVICFLIVSLTYWLQLTFPTLQSFTVVICFLIVSLTYWLQQISFPVCTQDCCDLLSNCIFDLLITAIRQLLYYRFSCDLLSNCIFDLLITAVPRFTATRSPLWFAF